MASFNDILSESPALVNLCSFLSTGDSIRMRLVSRAFCAAITHYMHHLAMPVNVWRVIRHKFVGLRSLVLLPPVQETDFSSAPRQQHPPTFHSLQSLVIRCEIQEWMWTFPEKMPNLLDISLYEAEAYDRNMLRDFSEDVLQSFSKLERLTFGWEGATFETNLRNYSIYIPPLATLQHLTSSFAERFESLDLDGFTNLRTLTLSNPHWSLHNNLEHDMTSWGQLPHLHTINLKNVVFYDVETEFEEHPHAFPSLTTLILDESVVPDAFYCCELPNLTHLKVENLESDTVNALALLSGRSMLQSVEISLSTGWRYGCFTALQSMPRLDSLTLDINPTLSVQTALLHTLNALETPQLSKLAFGSSFHEMPGRTVFFVAISHCPKVRELWLPPDFLGSTDLLMRDKSANCIIRTSTGQMLTT